MFSFFIQRPQPRYPEHKPVAYTLQPLIWRMLLDLGVDEDHQPGPSERQADLPQLSPTGFRNCRHVGGALRLRYARTTNCPSPRFRAATVLARGGTASTGRAPKPPTKSVAPSPHRSAHPHSDGAERDFVTSAQEAGTRGRTQFDWEAQSPTYSHPRKGRFRKTPAWTPNASGLSTTPRCVLA